MKDVGRHQNEQFNKSTSKPKKTELKEILKELLRQNQFLSAKSYEQMEDTKRQLDEMIRQFKEQKVKKN